MFSVLSKESLGLESPPTDLHVMPDGRVLVVAGRQLALGDGMRWEVFAQAAGDPPARALSLAVDRDGTLYQAVAGGFAKVVFGESGHWRLVKVADWPAGEVANRPVPRRVIETGNRWFWHSNSGNILSWRPGETAQVVGHADALERIFSHRGEYFLSDSVISDGSIIRLGRADGRPQGPREPLLPHGLITCALPFERDELLIGSSALGLSLFDGKSVRAFATQGALAGGQRINDLCVAGDGTYAAALENYGVVFFDKEGRILQSLTRTVDHRLSRVTRVIAGPSGIVWGLLNDGILRIGFPSRVSFFEPLIHSGLVSAYPRRLNGRLWVAADNQLIRATYDSTGRLTGFERDSPGDYPVFTMSSIRGIPIGSTDHGAYYRDAAGWHLFAAETINLRIPSTTPVDGQWLYTARNEVGWLRISESGPTLTAYPVPGLGDVYNANSDGAGNIWLERGTGRLGRIRPGRPGDGAPVVELYAAEHGVPQGWAQVFVVDGIARFNVADRILRFDEATRRFVPDEPFSREFARYGTIVGRPGRDALGRLWVTTEQGIHLFAGPLGKLRPVSEPMPTGFQPNYFTFESGGVVWLHSARRFARYDPQFPTPRPEPLRALITHVTLPSSGRTIHLQPGASLELPYADNTLIPHFLCPGDVSLSPITFEVRLIGPGQTDWMSAGSAGSTVFNQLGEGSYQLQVRPRSGSKLGEPTTLAFVIRPPWHRTPTAYAFGLLLLLGATYAAVRFGLFLQRQDRQRLERLVAQRTAELNETNNRLAQQMEEVRTLSQAIEQSPVGVVITDPAGRIVFANPRICRLSGYTLPELIGEPVRLLRDSATTKEAVAALDAALQRGESWDGQLVNRAKDGRVIQMHVTATPLRSTTGRIQHHLYLEEDITEWLAGQERRRRLEAQLFQAQKRESLGTLAGGIAHDFNNILTGILGYCELARLTLGPDSAVEQELTAITAAGRRAKDLVSQILSFTRPGNAQLTPLDLSRPVAEALKLFRASTPANIELVQELQSGTVQADASQIHQVVLNLCTNAAHALRQGPGRIEVRLRPVTLDAALAVEFGNVPPGDYLLLQVADNGAGMEPAVLDRIFDPFFTTKEPGEGTGLGLAIVHGIVGAHKGGLHVRSAPGKGTSFDIVFPVSTEPKRASNPPLPTPTGDQQEILVVDDEAMVTDFVAMRLRKLGYRAQVFHDPRAALNALLLAPGRFAALITDLTMPHLSGVELIHRLQQQGVSLPTLIITGYNRNSGRADLASVPDIPILQKPFTGEELALAVHRVLQAAPRG